jgi:demethylmenaquinone methyltransferase / 2-methoxy-6-polyprenyl-1,4-benzoquinol methylase
VTGVAPLTSPRTEHARGLFAGIAGNYDVMAELLSFGQNGRWRRFLASRIPRGGVVLDVATGTAGVAIELGRRRGARVVGVDQSPEMLAAGREAVERAGLAGEITLMEGQAERLPFPDASFDALTFTYLLRYVDDPGATLAELGRVVRPGGTVACLEFAVPGSSPWQAGWFLYTRMALPLGGLLASRDWYRTGRFLGPSISEFYRRYPLSEQGRMWHEAGLENVRYRTMSLGGAIVIWGVRGGSSPRASGRMGSSASGPPDRMGVRGGSSPRG